MRIEAHAARHVAAKANAAAELNVGLSAVAALLVADAGRARPSYRREEMENARSTTSNLPTAAAAAANLCCGSPRAAASSAAEQVAGAHTSCSTAPSLATPGAGHRLSGEAARHQRARPWSKKRARHLVSDERKKAASERARLSIVLRLFTPQRWGKKNFLKNK